MSKVGERVGAILGSEGKTLEFLGYGVYVALICYKTSTGPMTTTQVLKESWTKF